MNKEEFIKKIKEINATVPNEYFFLEYNKCVCDILEENQELEKQLENCYCNRTDCSARIKDSKKYDSLVQRIENQQKEFMEYLKQQSIFYDNNGVIQGIINNISNKYKEIIGDKDE